MLKAKLRWPSALSACVAVSAELICDAVSVVRTIIWYHSFSCCSSFSSSSFGVSCPFPCFISTASPCCSDRYPSLPTTSLNPTFGSWTKMLCYLLIFCTFHWSPQQLLLSVLWKAENILHTCLQAQVQQEACNYYAVHLLYLPHNGTRWVFKAKFSKKLLGSISLSFNECRLIHKFTSSFTQMCMYIMSVFRCTNIADGIHAALQPAKKSHPV